MSSISSIEQIFVKNSGNIDLCRS